MFMKHIIREQKFQNTKIKKNERTQTKKTNNVIIRKCKNYKVHTAIYKHKKAHVHDDVINVRDFCMATRNGEI